MTRHVVATVDEIAPGQCKPVTVKGREIGVFNVGGSFYALANRCPHAGGSLCEGEIVRPRRSPTARATTASRATASSCAARGTAGNTRSPPDNPGAIPRARWRGSSRLRSRTARTW